MSAGRVRDGRRLPDPPGLRPHGRFASGQCPACGEWFVLDRAAQPWARSRTCSTACARRLGNQVRRPSTCRHCEMVQAYRLLVDAVLRAREVPAGDEDLAAPPFRDWLRGYAWERPLELVS